MNGVESSSKWIWFGTPGHLIVAHRCRFRLHTHVGGNRYCVSTVGLWYVNYDDEKPTPIGGAGLDGKGRLFETYVFKLDPDGDTNGCEIDSLGSFTTEDAEANHLQLCKRWDIRDLALKNSR